MAGSIAILPGRTGWSKNFGYIRRCYDGKVLGSAKVSGSNYCFGMVMVMGA